MTSSFGYVLASTQEEVIQCSNIRYKQREIHIRSELERATEDVTDYVNLGLLRQIVIYGYKGSKKMLSVLIMVNALKDMKSVPYFYVNLMEKSKYIET